MTDIIFTPIKLDELEILIQKSVCKALKGEQAERAIHPSKIEDQLLTVQQAAEFLKLAVPTVYSLISKRELPVMKRSKRCYFSKAELINYLKEGRRKTLSETFTDANNYIKTRK